MGMDEAGAYSLCVLEVVGDNKLRNSELLVCKQHKQLARTRFWMLPPSCVQVGWARARGYIQLQRRCFWARIFFWKSMVGVMLGARCLSRGASPCMSFTSYHEDDASSDFSPALIIPGPRAGAAELFADQDHLSFTFMHTYIPLL